MKFIHRYRKAWKKQPWIMVSLYLMLAVLLASDLLYGARPLIFSYRGEWYVTEPEAGSALFEELNIQQGNYRRIPYDFAIWPLIPRDPKALDPSAAWLPPFSKRPGSGERAWLGTYDLGLDVWVSGLYGLRKSLALALLTVFLSGIGGIVLGAVPVLQAQRFRKMSWLSVLWIGLAGALLAYMVVLFLEWKFIPLQAFFFLTGGIVLALFLAIYFWNHSPRLTVNLDFITLNYMEGMKAIPAMLLLLILLQCIHDPGLPVLALMLTAFYLPVVLKYARAFTLHIVQEDYISSAIAIGQSGWMIFRIHVLPRLLAELLPVLAFGLANIILLEAGLSFLGIGFAVDEISLGTMMHAARNQPSAWWVVIFPGLMIFWLVVTFNGLGSRKSGNTALRPFTA
jgi:peptide/nickel transport system permease protein